MATFSCHPTRAAIVNVHVTTDMTRVGLMSDHLAYAVGVSRVWRRKGSVFAQLLIPGWLHGTDVYRFVEGIVNADREIRTLPCDRTAERRLVGPIYSPVYCGECPNCVRRNNGQDVMVLGALADLIEEGGLLIDESGYRGSRDKTPAAWMSSGKLEWLLEQLRVCAKTKQLAVR